jgi:uncharacterized protein (DUF885 family)
MLVAAVVSLTAGCSQNPPPQPFSALAEEFVFSVLANSPVAATQTGYHRHGDLALDRMLDRYSPAEIERQRRWYQDFRLRLMRSVKRENLSIEDRADYDIIQDQIALALLEPTGIQNYRHNPTLYVELIGSGLFGPFTLHYAGLDSRYDHIIGRLEETPRLLNEARRNLTSAPEIWTRVALDENQGNAALIDKTLRSGAPPHLKARYDAAAAPALKAIEEFGSYLRNDLAHRTGHDWRLGERLYAQKFRFVLGTDRSPREVLADAEGEMNRTRGQMYELSLPIYRKLFPERDSGNVNTVVRAVLDNIAAKHSTPESYFDDARRDLEEARQFTKSSGLLTLPPRDNLRIIETPEFMRGIYSVGGFSPAPPLEPQLGAYYWLTPIPASWSKERVESKLREYNYYGLKLLTIHEAIPGHYVQLEYANDIEPRLRRLIRSVFGNGPYIEGWAVYATEMMLDAGYLKNSPELRLTFLKQQLRVFANAILDVRLQTMGMNDEEAMDLMMSRGFQEREEAVGKLQRAKLSSAQLPTYFVGWRDWHRVRQRFAETRPASTPREFNELGLRAGAVPLPVLARLLTGSDIVEHPSGSLPAVTH